jgi:hypothetical protein
MKHKHRIIPGYEGGEYVEGNVVELTLTQHAMWHFAEWQRKGDWRDEKAWKGLAGLIPKTELLRQIQIEAGKKGGAIRAKQLRGYAMTPEEKEMRRRAMLGKKKNHTMRLNSSIAAKNRWAKPGAKDHFEKNEEIWHARFIGRDFSDRHICSKIAKELGVTYQCVRNWAARLGYRQAPG